MKKVLVDAVLIGNLGDDLFVKILLERYKDVSFSIIIDKRYKSFLNEFKNVKIVNYNFIRKGIEKFSRRLLNKRIVFNRYQSINDATVLISGSAFIQQNNYDSQIKIFENDINKVENYFMLGINFGPYSEENFKERFKNVFENCTDVCFREKYSYDLFSDLKNVRCEPDVVFTLDKEKYISKTNSKKVGISVIDLLHRDDLKMYTKKYEEKIVEIILDFINDGYEINLYSFCEMQNDEECVERIIQRIPEEKRDRINRKYYKGDIDYILNSISEDEYIIATRFHAMILGWIFDKKVFPLIYSNKMKNVIDDLNFEGEHRFIQDIDSLNIDIVKEHSKKLKNIREIEKKANKQFNKLDKFLSV